MPDFCQATNVVEATARRDASEADWFPVAALPSHLSIRRWFWFFPLLFGFVGAQTVYVDIVTHGRSLDAFGVGTPIVAVLAIAAFTWMMTKGSMGVPPTHIQFTADSVNFRYGGGRTVSLRLDTPKFRLEIRDVLGSWDPKDWKGVGPKSHRFFIKPPRGSTVRVDEATLPRIFECAELAGLAVTRSAGESRRGSDGVHRTIRIERRRSTG